MPGEQATPSPPLLEIPVFNRASVLPAIAAGCRRIELNATGSYPVGGTTPSLELVRDVSSDLDSLPFPVPLRVMIRPRGGDFVYTDEEQSLIQESIERIKPLLKQERGDGFVFGALRPAEGDGRRPVDWRLCGRVIGWCEPLPVVCHRAFDETVETDGAVDVGMARLAQRVAGAGFGGLLTSGGPGNAGENLAVVRRIVEEVRGTMEVIVGGGVRSGNVGEIYEVLNVVEGRRVVYHSSCLTGAGHSEEVDVDEVRRIVSVWQADTSTRDGGQGK